MLQKAPGLFACCCFSPEISRLGWCKEGGGASGQAAEVLHESLCDSSDSGALSNVPIHVDEQSGGGSMHCLTWRLSFLHELAKVPVARGLSIQPIPAASGVLLFVDLSNIIPRPAVLSYDPQVAIMGCRESSSKMSSSTLDIFFLQLEQRCHEKLPRLWP